MTGKLVLMIAVALSTLTALVPVFANGGGGNPPPNRPPENRPPDKPTPPNAGNTTVNVGPVTSTSKAEAEAKATATANPTATGGMAHATGGSVTNKNEIENKNTVNATGGMLHLEKGALAGGTGYGGAGGYVKDSGNSSIRDSGNSSSSSVSHGGAGGQGGAGGHASAGGGSASVGSLSTGASTSSVGNLSTGAATATNEGVQASGNTVNVQGDNINYKFPASTAAPQFLPPLICGDKAGGAGVQGMNFGFNFSFGGSRERCFETTEAAACVNGAIAIGAAFGKSVKIADAAIRCLAQMPAFKDAARDAGVTPTKMAQDMVLNLETALAAPDLSKELEKAKAQVLAISNASTAEKARADQLATELGVARDANQRVGRMLDEERAKKPKVVYRDRPSQTGTVEFSLKATCGAECPPKKQ